jgi:hypothetical protein
MSTSFRHLVYLTLPITLLWGCGGGEREADTAAADTVAIEPEPTVDAPDTAAPAAQPSEASRPVTVDDIERWQKGMGAEKQALQSVAAKVKAAKTTEEKLNLMGETHELSTAPAGADAAGLDEARYNFVRSKLSDAVKWLAPFELGSTMDSTLIPPSQQAQIERDREDYFQKMAWALPADVVEALKPRAVELRKQDLELAVERIRASGMAQ